MKCSIKNSSSSFVWLTLNAVIFMSVFSTGSAIEIGRFSRSSASMRAFSLRSRSRVLSPGLVIVSQNPSSPELLLPFFFFVPFKLLSLLLRCLFDPPRAGLMERRVIGVATSSQSRFKSGNGKVEFEVCNCLAVCKTSGTNLSISRKSLPWAFTRSFGAFVKNTLRFRMK